MSHPIKGSYTQSVLRALAGQVRVYKHDCTAAKNLAHLRGRAFYIYNSARYITTLAEALATNANRYDTGQPFWE